MVNSMDLGLICTTQINQYIKVILKMGFKTVKPKRSGQMELYMKEVLWEVKSKVLGSLSGLIHQSIKVTLMRTTLTVRANTHGPINVIIEENGETT